VQTVFVLEKMDEVNKTLQELLGCVTTITEKMVSVRKHMEDYRTNLDGIKRKLIEGDRTAILPCLAVHPNKGGLINSGLPLLDMPQTSVAGAAAGGAPTFHTAPNSPVDSEEVRIRAPRHDFPKFHGETLLMWIDQCPTYFEMFWITHVQWVSMASLYLEGKAALWYQSLRA
jgi:hypothetical protein